MVKNHLPIQETQETQVWSLGWEDSPGVGSGNQYSCLENSMDKGAWWAPVHGVTKSQTCLSDWARTRMELLPLPSPAPSLSLCQILSKLPQRRGRARKVSIWCVWNLRSALKASAVHLSGEKQRGHSWPEGSQHTGSTGLPGSEWRLGVRWAQVAREAGLVRLPPSCSSAFGSPFPHSWATDFLPVDSVLIPFFASPDGGWLCVHSHTLFLYQELHTPIYATITDLTQPHRQDC